MRESSIERKLREGCKKIGYESRKFVSPGHDGVPDRIVMGRGYTIFVETKTDVGKLSGIQRGEIRRMRRLGQDVRVVYGAKAVEDFLKEIASYEVQASRIPAPGD